MHRSPPLSLLVVVAVAATGCDQSPSTAPESSASALAASYRGDDSFGRGSITPFTGAAACLSGAVDEPLQLPAGYRQFIVGRQGDFPTTNPEVNFDMLTLNETGRDAGRYLYRTHEVSPWGALSVLDLKTGRNTLVAEREDWESFDGLVWTPWGTILMAEEEIVQSLRDPAYPNIERGLVYEYNPRTGAVHARPALGARSHEGLRFDAEGNLYGISESRGIANAGKPGESGSIFKFVPRRRGDLSAGTLYALKVQTGRTGGAVWERLNLDPTTFDSDAAAQAVGATGWDRPEDVEIGRVRGEEVLYVAVTESSDFAVNSGLVLKIVLKGRRAVVSNYVEPGVNVANEVGGDTGTGFDDPDNVALGPDNELYITEDDSPGDIWVARGSGPQARSVEVFARLLDCGAEPTGVYYDAFRRILWVNSQHAALNSGADLTLGIKRAGRDHDDVDMD